MTNHEPKHPPADMAGLDGLIERLRSVPAVAFEHDGQLGFEEPSLLAEAADQLQAFVAISRGENEVGDLIERLHQNDIYGDGVGFYQVNAAKAESLCDEAATQLQALAARVKVLEAENERLREALREMFEVVCGKTGFAQAVRADSGFAYPWPALDLAEAKARAALGKEITETFTRSDNV